MAKNSASHNIGCFTVVAMILIGFYTDPGVTILLAIGAVFVFLYVKSNSRSTNPSKTVTHSKTVFGNRTKRIEYHDTGKVVEQLTSPTWTGGKKTETRVVNPGRAGHQTCHKCGASVAGHGGRYICDCGHCWGR